MTSLAGALAAAGYQTGAVMALRGLVGEGDLVGFDAFDGVATPSSSEDHPDNAVAVTDRAIRWLEARAPDRSSFLWIHYIDRHATYRQPPGAPVYGSEDIDRYDAEIALVDAQLRRLLRAVAAAKRPKGTIVAVAADHGESFGEHGAITHAKNLYEDQTRVPLVIAIPGGVARPRPVRSAWWTWPPRSSTWSGCRRRPARAACLWLRSYATEQRSRTTRW